MRKSERTEAKSEARFPDCVLGAGTRLEGRLACLGFLRVEGECLGDLSAAGTLVVAEDAEVRGSLTGADVVVAGEVEGPVSARGGSVRLAETARLRGDVEAGSFSMRRGAIFRGRVTRRS